MPNMALFQILTRRKFENLETLVTSYSWNSWESETAPLNALHSLCPRLLHLEFNRYGTEPKADALDVMVGFRTFLRRGLFADYHRSYRYNMRYLVVFI